MTNLRDLRLWHWRQMRIARMQAHMTNNYRTAHASGFAAQVYNEEADFHMKVVQLLNDAHECRGTTAEQDDHESS